MKSWTTRDYVTRCGELRHSPAFFLMDFHRDGIELALRKHMRTRSVPIDLNSTLAVTLIMRASQKAQEYGAKLLSGDTTPLSREEAEDITSADPKDRQAVLVFAASRGLRVTGEDARARKVCVTGTISQMNAAFGVNMRMQDDNAGQHYLSYTGQIALPQGLRPVVEAVLGLDGRPAAKSRFAGPPKVITSDCDES